MHISWDMLHVSIPRREEYSTTVKAQFHCPRCGSAGNLSVRLLSIRCLVLVYVRPSISLSSRLAVTCLTVPGSKVAGGMCRLWTRQPRFMQRTWWRHQMETFSALLAICAGNSPVNGEFPSQRPMPRSFDVFFDLGLNKRLIKQSWGWWFMTSE